jgi:transcriptional regulator with XRE-family HTH domain
MTTITKAEVRGRWIAYHRDLLGLTQTQLGAQVGLSLNTINRTEKGHRVVAVDEVDKLAGFFGVESAYLLDPPVPPSVTVSTGPFFTSDGGATHNPLRLVA